MPKYQPIVFVQGDDYVELERHLYPEKEGFSLGWPQPSKAVEYLAQWDMGEYGEEPKDEFPFVAKGNECVYDDDDYVLVWSPIFVGMAGLWRKVEDDPS